MSWMNCAAKRRKQPRSVPRALTWQRRTATAAADVRKSAASVSTAMKNSRQWSSPSQATMNPMAVLGLSWRANGHESESTLTGVTSTYSNSWKQPVQILQTNMPLALRIYMTSIIHAKICSYPHVGCAGFSFCGNRQKFEILRINFLIEFGSQILRLSRIQWRFWIVSIERIWRIWIKLDKISIKGVGSEDIHLEEEQPWRISNKWMS